MQVPKNVRLRVRLLSGFSLVAILALLVGGGGILALTRVGKSSEKTAKAVTGNVASQIEQTEITLQLRSMLDQASSMKESGQAGKMKKELTALKGMADEQVLRTLEGLVSLKANDLEARRDQVEFQRTASLKVDRIAGNITEVAQTIEAEASVSIENAFNQAKSGIEKGNVELEGQLNTLSEINSTSLEQVAAALSIRALSGELEVILLNIQYMSDAAMLDYARNQVAPILLKISEQAASIPSNESLEAISAHVKKVEAMAPLLCDMQKEYLQLKQAVEAQASVPKKTIKFAETNYVVEVVQVPVNSSDTNAAVQMAEVLVTNAVVNTLVKEVDAEQAKITENANLTSLETDRAALVKTVDAHMEKISSLSMEVADSVGFDVMIMLEDVMDQTKEKSQKNQTDIYQTLQNISEVTQSALDNMNAALVVLDCSQKLKINVLSLLLAEDESRLSSIETNLKTVYADLDAGLKNLTQNEQVKAASDQISALRQDTTTLVNARRTSIKTQQELAAEMLATARMLGEITIATLEDSKALSNEIQNGLKEGMQFIRDWIGILAIVCIMTIIAAMGIGWYIIQSVNAFMRRNVNALKQSAQDVLSYSDQVSASSQSLAEGATEQAASIEESSASLEELSAMVRHNADNAQQANILASSASELTEKGEGAMERMAGAINEIRTNSSETAKIIKVIDEIAFQTNLLALNAAVEAARAGEAGKGFAVVAEEVRNLAMRSAEAARNTSDLIENAVSSSENGVGLMQDVSAVLEEIASATTKSQHLISEIAQASQEQSQGVSEINSAITQLESVTQQNSAAAEESASAAIELRTQSDQMRNAVGAIDTFIS